MAKVTRFEQFYRWLLVVGGTLGVLAAGILMVDKIKLIEQPHAVLECDINPIVACGSVILTDQASAFGFPNPIIGLVGFPIVITVGMALFAGAKFRRWFWLGLQAGTLFGVGFVHWLFYQSVYNINALCPYCMVVWTVTIPIFWYTLLYNLRLGHIKLPKNYDRIIAWLQTNHFGVLILWYMIIAGLILKHFDYYFLGA